MAYTPKTWECGETITADALNHIEQGIASSGGGTEPLVVHPTGIIGGMILDRTWQEIFDYKSPCFTHFKSGMLV